MYTNSSAVYSFLYYNLVLDVRELSDGRLVTFHMLIKSITENVVQFVVLITMIQASFCRAWIALQYMWK